MTFSDRPKMKPSIDLRRRSFVKVPHGCPVCHTILVSLDESRVLEIVTGQAIRRCNRCRRDLDFRMAPISAGGSWSLQWEIPY